jgi:hypothetical protein
VKLLLPSGHSTLRVFLEPEVDPESFFRQLEELGCKFSRTERERFYALDVPESADIIGVLDFLSNEQDAGRSDWAVGSISGIHGAALRAVMDPDDLPAWVPRD